MRVHVARCFSAWLARDRAFMAFLLEQLGAMFELTCDKPLWVGCPGPDPADQEHRARAVLIHAVGAAAGQTVRVEGSTLEPDSDDTFNLDLALRRETDRLATEFRGKFNRETIERYARESLERLGEVSVTRYLPIFAYRFTRERLVALAEVEGLLSPDCPNVLFVCVRNAARSQMAAALARHLSGGLVEAHSAGSAPAGEIDPIVVAVMCEIGLDLSQEVPKPLAEEIVRAADVVITMGCGDVCPVYPFKVYEDWELQDPIGRPLSEVRQIRDEVRERVQSLLSRLDMLGQAWVRPRRWSSAGTGRSARYDLARAPHATVAANRSFRRSQSAT